jgi:transcription elongation factor GreA
MKEFITKENKDALETELAVLTSSRRKEVVAAIESAKKLGDLSENAEYHIAREEQGKLEERIATIEHVLKNAEIVKRSTNGVVNVGTTIVIQKVGEQNTRTFIIVGSEETDMLAGKISYKSPLGTALFGRKEGEVVSVATPKGDTSYKILSVN